MKLKLVATLSLLAMGAMGTAIAAPASSSLSKQVAALQAQVSKLQSQVNGMGTSSSAGTGSSLVGFYSPLTWQLLDNYTGVGSEMYILQARQNNNLANSTVYFGGLAKVDAIFKDSNTAGTFANNHSNVWAIKGGDTSTELQMTQATLDVIANVNSMATGYMELSSYDIGNTNNSNTLSIRKAYVLLGDLNNSPVYGLVGKNTVNFGNFSTVNMYSQPLDVQAFEALSTQAAIGYSQYGFNGVFTLMNGSGSTLDQAAPGTNVYTNGNQVNNFALNVNYGANNNGVNWKVGAGYLNGSAFAPGAYVNNSSAPTQANGQRNAAWDLNGSVAVGAFGLNAEYVSTVDNFVNNQTVKSFDIGGNYAFQTMGRNSIVSLDYSKLNMGGNGTYNGSSKPAVIGGNYDQYVVGFRNEVASNVWAGVEYTFNDGVYNGINSSSTNSNANNNTVLVDLTAAF